MGSKELIAQYEEAAAASGNPELFRAAEAVSWESYHGMGPQAFNLTPHPIMVHPADREPWEVPRTGFLARLDEEDGPERHEGRIGAPVVSRLFARVTVSGPSGEAYPFPRLGLIGSKSSPLLWVVSLPVAQALTGRPDVIAPDTGRGSVIRDDRGQVVGVRRFVRMGVECLECGHFQAATTLCEACGEFVGGDAVVEAIEAAD